ncbi:MAG: hypothetical protein H7Z37_02360 [Pyrinomonadaceae bacterium]|nr:hypothetical protein [Pyrinomonadaceae bacterium]
MNYFNYFSEIEETFVRLRGKNLLLSPLDWALIEAWKEREIPLHIVLRALENVFDAQKLKQKQIKSLLYCREEVEKSFMAWQNAQIGSVEKVEKLETVILPESEQSEILQHLRTAHQNLLKRRENLNHDWQSVSTRIAANIAEIAIKFKGNADFETLETKLHELDNKIDAALLESTAPNVLSQVKTELETNLRSHKKAMNAAIYEQTLTNLTLKALREKADLPKFSLFYL